MTPTATAAIGALAFCLIAIFALLPAARTIPARLDAQWLKEVEAHLQQSDAILGTDYSYSVKQKVLLAVAAGVLGFGVVWKYGTAAAGIAFAFYFLSLTLLVAINLKHSLLPDVVVLSTLWVGLLFQASAGNASTSIYGASVGYLVPFLVGLAFKITTRVEVIGRGDLKALAMAGAWFGIDSMPMIFGAFIAGLILWFFVVKLVSRRSEGHISTGPGHLVASLVAALGTNAF